MNHQKISNILLIVLFPWMLTYALADISPSWYKNLDWSLNISKIKLKWQMEEGIFKRNNKTLGFNVSNHQKLGGRWTIDPIAKVALGQANKSSNVYIYNGKRYDIDPHKGSKNSDNPDFLIELKLPLTYHWNNHISIDLGLGYRQFKTYLYTTGDLNLSYGDRYSYDRKIRATSSYFYWPTGIAYVFYPSKKLSIGIHLEHDLLFSGMLDSMPHDNNESLILHVNQNSGHAFKVNLDISKKKSSIHYEPYLNYWKITSFPNVLFGKGNHISKEIGFNVSWKKQNI